MKIDADDRGWSWRVAAALLLALMAFALSACVKSDRASAQKLSFSECRRQLGAIPGMEALLDPSRRADESEEERPFDGLQIALTINGTIQGEGRSEEDEDDECARLNNRINFDRLLGALKESRMPPALNFVAGQDVDPVLQQEWLRSGNAIGFFTYGRIKARHSSAAVFIEDLIKNEEALAPLTAKFPLKHKYFRYPRMKENYDEQTAVQIREYLASKGFIEVPATIDARDWRFSQIYCAALSRDDRSCAAFVKQCFFSLLTDTTLKARQIAHAKTGRDCRQVLMVEATQLTVDYLSELISWYRRLGARFIPVEEALADPIYATADAKELPAAVHIYREVKQRQTEPE